jgi:two-component system nitrogen regulation sensor histidine kinase NtrY
VTLARRVPLLLCLLFVPLAALAAYAARSSALGLALAEAAVLVALAVSWRFLRLGRAARDLASSGRELLAEGDFATRFRILGQRDVDELVALFNALSEELRRERLRLEERNLLLGKLVAASPAGVVMLDLEGRVDLVNPAAAALLGCGAAAALPIVGRPATDLPPPFGAASGLAAGAVQVVALAGGRHARIARAEFEDRGFGRTFLLIEEITDEIRASERSAYEKVIRLVSHEVNNSAGAIASLLESSRAMLRAARREGASSGATESAGGAAHAADAAEVDEALAVAGSRIRHLAAFVDGFAEVVRLPEPVLRRFDLAELARDLVTLHRAEATSRAVTLDLGASREPSAPVYVVADREQIEQAVVNLLRNAFEATPAGGRIAVTLAADGRTAALTIRDSGPGIAAAVATQLFTPFFSTKRDGRGLGLTLVRELALRHGGEVGLHTHPDGGAVAELRLPLAAVRLPASPTA